MTVIIGLKSSNKIYIGADSAITANNLQSELIEPKVFRVGNILLAQSGLHRAGQLIQYNMKKLPPDKSNNPTKYLVTQLVPAIRHALNLKDEEENLTEFGMVIGYKKRLFQVDGALCIYEVNREFVVDGSGGDIAIGVMEATSSDIMQSTPIERVKLAIAIACKYNIYCDLPIIIKSI